MDHTTTHHTSFSRANQPVSKKICAIESSWNCLHKSIHRVMCGTTMDDSIQEPDKITEYTLN